MITRSLLGLLLTVVCGWMLQDTATTKGPTAASLEQNSDLAKLFDYKPSGKFDVREDSTNERDGVIIQDVNYAAETPQRGRIKAFMIKPTGKGPFAGILFFHWLGEPNGDRTQFVDEAVALARLGVASLLIQGYFPWVVQPTEGTTDRHLIVSETREVRRALDLLIAQPMVDKKRIGYVGHDYGAMYGGIAAAFDKRVRAYVLIAGIGTFSDWSLEYWLKSRGDEFKKSYRQALFPLEPITLIDRAKPAALLFQFANNDKYITKEKAISFAAAASEPKEVRWYDTTHEMNVQAARDDRREWLTERLKLRKSGR